MGETMFPPWTPFFCCSARSGFSLGSRPGKPASAHELLPTLERGESQNHGQRPTSVRTEQMQDLTPVLQLERELQSVGGAELVSAGAQGDAGTRTAVKKGRPQTVSATLRAGYRLVS